jgi:hypothetical protein
MDKTFTIRVHEEITFWGTHLPERTFEKCILLDDEGPFKGFYIARDENNKRILFHPTDVIEAKEENDA